VLTTLGGVVAVVLCIAANAFFVAAEFALVTVRDTWVRERCDQRKPGAKLVHAAKHDLDGSIAATQLGITLASIALGWLGEPAIARLLEAPVCSLYAAHSIATVLAFGGITFLHVVLGELAPKAVALGRPEAVALAVAGPLLVFRNALHPVVAAMNATGGWVVRRLGFTPARVHERAHSVAELGMLVEETRAAAQIDTTQADVAQRSLRFGELRVRDVMVTRARMQVLDEELDGAALARRLEAVGFSRLPVWSRRRGGFVGVANAKMLMTQLLARGRVDLRRASFAPPVFAEGERLTRALRAFQRTRQHLALVVGQGGGIVGLITLEDVLEELVGEIEDELDMEELGAPRPSQTAPTRPSRLTRPSHPSRPSLA
jgi:CBS domain containing-hemolysin-like protein